METVRPKNARKVLLIDPAFQLSFLRLICGIAVVVILMFYASNCYLFWSFARKGHDLGLPADHIFFRFIDRQRTTMDVIFLLTSILAFLVLIFSGLHLSNRVAGPLHRLRMHLASKREGRVGLKFREGDYFQDLAEAVNAALTEPETRTDK